ncbi:MAG: alkaline phosphatase [Oligoflexales bacterium]
MTKNVFVLSVFLTQLLYPYPSLKGCAHGLVHKPAKNVILFIGDGMGLASLTGSRIWAHGSAGQLHIEKLPTIGLVKTFSSSDYVTDSAAAATTLASGVKTYNGAIGVSDPEYDPTRSSRDVETLIDVAKKLGKSTGIISTARVTHATPASFYAHTNHRSNEAIVAQQIATSQLDLLFGGGIKGVDHKESFLKNLNAHEWVLIQNKSQLFDEFGTKKVLGVFSKSHMSYESNRDLSSSEPSLQNMVDAAVTLLKKNPSGFFLVVESGRIDHAAHLNDARNHFNEIQIFDQVIGKEYDRDHSETLIIVTSDHETGGLALSGYQGRKETRGENLFFPNSNQRHFVSFASGPGHSGDHFLIQPSLYLSEVAMHTAVDVPIFSAGPCSSFFQGFMGNDDIAWKIAKSMGGRFTSKVNIENWKLYVKP